MMEKGKWFSKMADKVKKEKKETAEEATQTAENSEKVDSVQQEPENTEEKTDELDSLKKENEDLKNKLLRQMAEFDNYKKRTAKEKDELYQYAKSDCVETILGVIDNFERALDTQCSDENFKKGVEMIFTQFQNALEKLGVEEIKALGEPFDPQYHNAVSQVEDENFGENTVCQVFQKGYKVGNKVIRHAMVVVANS